MGNCAHSMGDAACAALLSMLPVQEEPQMSDSANVKQQVSDAEWQARVDLAAAYRLVAHFHWDDLVFTHISSRVPGEAGLPDQSVWLAVRRDRTSTRLNTSP